MKTSRLVVYMLGLFLTACCISCNDSDKGGNPDEPGNSKLTPEQHKAKIEEIGKDFVAKFKSTENEKVAKSLYDLQEMIEGSNFTDLFDVPVNAVNDLTFLSLASVITKNDIQALTRTVTNPEEYRWLKYTGIYTYNGHQWAKEATSSKTVEIRFTSGSAGNAACVLTASYSNEKDYTDLDGYIIEVPGKINMTLKVGSEEVLNFSANINLDTNQKSVDANANLTVSTHYIWTVNASANGNKGTVNYEMTIRNEKVMSATAELTGSNLTDPDYIDQNESHLNKVFDQAQFTYQILNMTIKGNGDVKSIITAENELEDYKWGDEASSKKYAEAEAAIYNQYAQLYLVYTQENEKIADIKMKTDWEEEYVYNSKPDGTAETKSWKEWYMTPVMVFTSDNSEMAIEDYFTEARFNSLIRAAETLTNEFTEMLGLTPVEF